MGLKEEALAVFVKAVQKEPLFWGSWTEIAQLCKTKEEVKVLKAWNIVMLKIIKKYVYCSMNAEANFCSALTSFWTMLLVKEKLFNLCCQCAHEQVKLVEEKLVKIATNTILSLFNAATQLVCGRNCVICVSNAMLTNMRKSRNDCLPFDFRCWLWIE